MRRLTLVAIAFGTVLGLSVLPLFGQSCGMQCPGECLKNSLSSQGTATFIGDKPPLEVLSRNPQLAAKLQALLPSGTNVMEVASGFKNLRQFVAALHVSHDLGMPFDQLRSKLVGTGKTSLSKAIQELSPEVNFKAELKKVSKQTDADLATA